MTAAARATTSASEIASKLLARQPQPPLVPTRPWDADLTREIDSADASDVVKATLHLLNDDIGRAHNLAQAHEESQTANLTHAILHRREGDYWNSKWWLSRIRHPLIESVHGSTAKAKAFVDECERAADGGTRKAKSQTDSSGNASRLQERQWEELQGLVRHALSERTVT